MSPHSIGKSTPPEEDCRFVTGSSNYVDDVSVKGMLYCGILRSTYAHAKIKNVDASALSSSHSVVGAFVAEDIDRVTVPFKVTLPIATKPMYYRYLAKNRVRWAGEPVVAVVAKDRYSAEDALESIVVEYEALPPVTDPEKAAEADSPSLYDEWGDNSFAKVESSYGNLDNAFDNADCIVEEKIKVHRYTGSPIETRGCVCSFDSNSGNLLCWTSTQQPHVQKSLLSEVLGLPQNRIRVISPDVGGGFGVKLNFYPEDAIVAAISMLTGNTIKWIESRNEHFQASSHARSQTHFAKMALTKDGTILGLSDKIIVDVGAFTLFPHHVVRTANVTSLTLPGPYRIQNYGFQINFVVTNKTPFGAYRGFGHPEATFVTERLIEMASKELHVDSAQLREKNMIFEFPYTSANGAIHDSGSNLECLHRAMHVAGVKKFRRLQAKYREIDRYLGIGFACNVEQTVSQLYKVADVAFVRLEADGRVNVSVGLASIGTSIETVLKQIASSELGCGFDDVTVTMCDTDRTPYSTGNYGSRSAAAYGAAVAGAIRLLRKKIVEVGARLLGCQEGELTIHGDAVVVKNDHRRKVSFKDIAKAASELAGNGGGEASPSLEVKYTLESPESGKIPEGQSARFLGATTNATHAAIVEVDVETGLIDILKYIVVHDCGRIINPLVVKGQIVGGVVQSIGGTLLEELSYDENGQLLSSSFSDYLIPNSVGTPDVKTFHRETPSPFIPGGFKGAGETGTIGVPAALANAVEDALSPFKVKILETPISPDRIWKMLAKR